MKNTKSVTIRISHEAKIALKEALPLVWPLHNTYRDEACDDQLPPGEWNRRMNLLLLKACAALLRGFGAGESCSPQWEWGNFPWPIAFDPRKESKAEIESRIAGRTRLLLPGGPFPFFDPEGQGLPGKPPKSVYAVRVRPDVKAALDQALPLLMNFEAWNEGEAGEGRIGATRWQEGLHILLIAACDALVSHPGEKEGFPDYFWPLEFDARCENEYEKAARMALQAAFFPSQSVS